MMCQRTVPFYPTSVWSKGFSWKKSTTLENRFLFLSLVSLSVSLLLILYMCTYTCTHTCTCSHTFTHAHTCHTCTHMCTHVYTCTHMSTCIHTNTYIHIHVHTHIHMCTHHGILVEIRGYILRIVFIFHFVDPKDLTLLSRKNILNEDQTLFPLMNIFKNKSIVLW